jgi:hypothetical protein
VPARFWSEPYIVGFFQLMISHHLKLATGGRLAGEDMGLALTDVFTALSNMNGVAIVRRGLELATANDSDFNRAADDAAAICYYQMRVLKNETDHPLVKVATRMAIASGKAKDSREEICSLMYVASLFKEVDRLRENSILPASEASFPYPDFESWYRTYKAAVGEEKPTIEPMLDWMDNEPLRRAFRDRVDPKWLGKQFAENFDPSQWGL